MVRTLCFQMPWTVAHQAPLSMEFPRQEYWSGLPFPTPGALPDPGIKPSSPASPALAGRREWIHVWLGPFTVHLRLSQHC